MKPQLMEAIAVCFKTVLSFFNQPLNSDATLGHESVKPVRTGKTFANTLLFHLLHRERKGVRKQCSEITRQLIVANVVFHGCVENV